MGALSRRAGWFFLTRKEPDAKHGEGEEERAKEKTFHVRMRLLSAGDFLDRFFREVRVGEPFLGSFPILTVEDPAGVDESAATGHGVGNAGGPLDADGGVIVDDAGGVAISGSIAIGGGDRCDGGGGFFRAAPGPVVEGGADGVVFSVALGKVDGPLDGAGRIFFGIFSGEALKGLVLKGSFWDVRGPVGGFLPITGAKDSGGGDVNHLGGFFVSVLKAFGGELGGELGIGISEAEGGAPFHMSSATLFFRCELVEVGESRGGITGGPASEGGGHVAFWSILSVRDSFLSGDGTPSVVKFAEFG